MGITDIDEFSKSPRSMASVMHAERCIGFLFKTAKGLRAFDPDGVELGTFDDARAAINEITVFASRRKAAGDDLGGNTAARKEPKQNGQT